MLLTQKLIEHFKHAELLYNQLIFMQGSFKNDVIPFIESHYDSTVQTIEFINTI